MSLIAAIARAENLEPDDTLLSATFNQTSYEEAIKAYCSWNNQPCTQTHAECVCGNATTLSPFSKNFTGNCESIASLPQSHFNTPCWPINVSAPNASSLPLLACLNLANYLCHQSDINYNQFTVEYSLELMTIIVPLMIMFFSVISLATTKCAVWPRNKLFFKELPPDLQDHLINLGTEHRLEFSKKFTEFDERNRPVFNDDNQNYKISDIMMQLENKLSCIKNPPRTLILNHRQTEFFTQNTTIPDSPCHELAAFNSPLCSTKSHAYLGFFSRNGKSTPEELKGLLANPVP